MVFFQKNVTIFIIFGILLIHSKGSYISLEFTKQEKSSELKETNFTLENFVLKYIEPKFSSIIEVGNPPQKVELIFSPDNYGLSLIEDPNCTLNYIFNKKLSSSINITHSYDSKFFLSPKKPIVLTDTIYLPLYDSNTNKLSKVEVKEYPYVYLTKNPERDIYENKDFIKEEDGKAYMIYGSELYCNWRNEIGENLPFHLKSKDIISSHIFNVVYNKRNSNENKTYDFEIIIGSEPHNISPDKYDTNDLKYINALSYSGELNWIIEFHEVFYFPENFKLNINNNLGDFNEISLDINLNDKKLYSYDDRALFSFDLDGILCPKFYYFTINKTFFGNHTDKCKIQRLKKYSIFVCDKDFNTKNFPSIYFYHKDLNYTFILTENELFKIIGDKKYFLIVYDLFRPTFWMFGKIFLEKYTFNFDMDKRIGFYNDVNKHKKNTNIKKESPKNTILLINLVWLGVVLIILIISFFIVGKKVFYKIRKKRANELDDNYEYEVNEDNIEKNNESLFDDNNNEKLNYNKIID